MCVCVFDEDGIDLIWESVNDAEGYKVYRQVKKGFFDLIYDIKDNYCKLFGFQEGDVIKIKPYKINNNNIIYMPQTIIILKNTNSENKLKCIYYIKQSCVHIFWTNILGAKYYKIFNLSLSNELPVKSDICKGIIKGLPFGVTKLCITAYDKDDKYITSSDFQVYIDTLELFAVNKPDYKIELLWNKINGYDGYRLFKMNDKGVYEGIQSIEGKENCILSNLIPGEKYSFKIKPYKYKHSSMVYSNMAAVCNIKVNTTNIIDLTIIEAWDKKLAISYNCPNTVEGFDIFVNNKLYKNIKDGLSHIILIDYINAEFCIKGYQYLCNEKVYTCQSDAKKVQKIRKNKPIEYTLSVVIPAYNSQDYISRTICSALCSTINDIEIIIVNDGSKDNTKDVIDWYAKKYPYNIKVIHKENSGVCDSRNVGIEQAKASYIAFMDNDDTIRPQAFEKQYNAIIKTGVDVVMTPLFRVDNDKYVVRNALQFEENKAFEISEYLRLIFTKYANVGIWNKLYRAELLKKHLFSKQVYEDVSWTPYLLSWADNFCYISDIGYEWDRKIRSFTQSNVLSKRGNSDKFNDRYASIKFFYDNGNPKHKDCLAYIMAYRLYEQGTKAKYQNYFDAIKDLKPALINNKYLLEDSSFYNKISEYIK